MRTLETTLAHCPGPNESEPSTSVPVEEGTKFNSLPQISTAVVEISLNAPAMRFPRQVFRHSPAVL